jgi:hypothetical protein
MRIERESQQTEVAGERGLATGLASRSPFQGKTDVETLLTVLRPEGLFYMVFISPRSESAHIDQSFKQVISSLQFFGT